VFRKKEKKKYPRKNNEKRTPIPIIEGENNPKQED
jgi:hypothetical protein